ncbi:MAG: tetratricopeptide repeat protein, partial [Salinivirgaceae bacterium]|nr:tetratricopeptide repeat protein [Salinivirgaceae bacterium]
MKNFNYKFIVVILLLVFTALYSKAQNSGETNKPENHIALQFYRNGEFDKAAEVYKKLYYSNRTNTYYRYLLNCYQNLKEYEKAEDLIKEQIKFNKYELSYLVDLGQVYSQIGNESKANASYQSAIKKLKADQHQVIRLANSFLSKRLNDYAEATYEEGKRLLKGAYGFQMEMAQLYYYQRNYDKMINSYLDVLAISEMYLQQVQNRLQQAVYNDVDESLTQKLKDALLLRLNKQPEVVVFSELLIWLYIQDKDFESAFIQAKALDLRLSENGQRLLALARVATNNLNFAVAIKAYQQVISKGKHLEYYFDARNELLQVMYQRISLGLDNQLDDYRRMEEALMNALDEMGTNIQTLDLVKNLAHLQAFYLGKTAEGQFLLEDAITLSGLDYRQKGNLELELADIYLLDGKVWDATIAYARVEDKNKNNTIGFEAKFRKGRLAYFIGNFEWAKGQLDVLKASTSKLIANDAAELAFFIYENTGWDSLETALETYARADLLFYQSKYDQAIQTIDSVITNFPDHEVLD